MIPILAAFCHCRTEPIHFLPRCRATQDALDQDARPAAAFLAVTMQMNLAPLNRSTAKSAEKDRPELPESVSLNSNGFERTFRLLFLCALRTAMPRFDRRLRRFNAEGAEIRRGFFFSAFLCALRVSALKIGYRLGCGSAALRLCGSIPFATVEWLRLSGARSRVRCFARHARILLPLRPENAT